MDAILEFIKNNAASVLTLLGVILTQLIGYHLGRVKDDSERNKNVTDAEQGMREDLQAQLDRSEERHEKKDVLIRQLSKENDEWRFKAMQSEIEIARKSYQIEVLQKRLDEYEKKVFYIPTSPTTGGE